MRGRAVLSIFSMQGFGKLTAAVLNYACITNLNYYGGPWTADAVWRFTFAFGCVPNLLTLYWRFKIVESEIYTNQREKEIGEDGEEVLKSGRIKMLPLKVMLDCLWEYWTLVGTASTWFLIDVTFYGQSLMNTTVVNTAVAGTSTNSVDKLRWALCSTVYIMLIALPGYFIAITLIDAATGSRTSASPCWESASRSWRATTLPRMPTARASLCSASLRKAAASLCRSTVSPPTSTRPTTPTAPW